MSFRALVLAALDAGDHAPDSDVGRTALDMAPDVRRMADPGSESDLHWYAYHCPRVPPPQDAAVNLVLTAEREVARGVRRVGQ